MKYNNIVKGLFKKRPDRFTALVEIDDKIEICHVKNTGRCKELLIDNAVVYLEKVENNSKRKTKYSIIAVEKGDILINMDSQAPNKVIKEWLERGGLCNNITFLKSEAVYKKSRFDFYFETSTEKAFVEVKGVTLEENGIVRFPDAPSERAVKHIKELSEALDEGYKCYIIFVIQMNNVKWFEPNYKTHNEFGQVLGLAIKKGVNAKAYSCIVKKDSIVIGENVNIKI